MAAGLRIDKLLWFLRLARTRAGAGLGAGGHIRLNGRRVERAHQGVSTGDILVIPLGSAVRVIEMALPERRGRSRSTSMLSGA
jgi:ribosome-associated heat shock protein Hsp15